MPFLTELWLPIVLSAVLVFIVSTVIHMVLPIHKGDAKRMKNEDDVLEAMRTHGVEPGAYMFPCASSMKEMGSPEMVEKLRRGPVGWLTVLPPGGFDVGRGLIWWFVLSLLIGSLVAYVGWYALGAGATFGLVFRVTGTAAILGYAVGHVNESIWKGAPWSTSAKFFLDGVVYGLVTAATFGWLWPESV